MSESKSYKSDCPHCEFLYTLFSNVKDMTSREYWIMTELFVYLHDKKDFCDYKDK